MKHFSLGFIETFAGGLLPKLLKATKGRGASKSSAVKMLDNVYATRLSQSEDAHGHSRCVCDINSSVHDKQANR